MGNQLVKKYKKTGFIVSVLLFVIVTVLAFITLPTNNFVTENNLLLFAIENHTIIMTILIIISVAFGYFWAFFLYKELEKKNLASKNMLDVVFLFLGDSEKKILNFLVEKNGKTTQAEIARLQGMGKVKAFRSVQRMQEKYNFYS